MDVLLDASFRPLAVYASQHKCGSMRLWDRSTSWISDPGTITARKHTLNKAARLGNHPVIWVSRGSHANYFKHGSQNIYGKCFGSPAPKSYDQMWMAEQGPLRAMVPTADLVGDPTLHGLADQVRISENTNFVKYTVIGARRKSSAAGGGSLTRRLRPAADHPA